MAAQSGVDSVRVLRRDDGGAVLRGAGHVYPETKGVTLEAMQKKLMAE